MSPVEPCWLVGGKYLCAMCYQSHRIRERVRSLFRQSLAYQHSIEALEMVEAQAYDWTRNPWHGRHLFERVIPPPLPSLPPSEAVLQGAQDSTGPVTVYCEIVFGGEPSPSAPEHAHVATPTESAEGSIPNRQPGPDFEARPSPDVPFVLSWHRSCRDH